MNTQLLITGQIYAIAKKVFEDKETVYAQFLNKQENGGVEILQVKLTDSNDISLIKEGMKIKVPVKVSSYNNAMYYTQTETLIK